ncbi:hypothetical protein [uncultured Tissierella sp.]|uniref:hypothetical protein n=1 Tax=uncultured Tissierella sp. TaxID=448160 RepID=UPI0028062A30|nr:hypothetical protein [uncultured Tissierella sp.]MDU5082832.1 hypothetical protein [Bacillota bacterium]
MKKKELNEFKKIIIEEYPEDFISQIYPCYNLETITNNNIDFHNCANILKCEWINNVSDFIKYLNHKEYKAYKWARCLDDGSSKGKEPECELINDYSNNDKLVVEVKSIVELTDKEKREKFSFINFNKIIETMINFDKQLLYKLNTKPYSLRICSEIKWGKNNKIENAELVIKNIKRAIDSSFSNSIDNSLSEEFEVGGAKFIFGVLNKECAKENGIETGLTINGPLKMSSFKEFIPEFNKFKQKIDEYINSTVEKFNGYDEHRKILLLFNDSKYFSSELKKYLSEIKRPDIIKELWFAEYETQIIDEYMNEEVVGLKYEMILEED